MTDEKLKLENGMIVEFSLKLFDGETGELIADSAESEDPADFVALYRTPIVLPDAIWTAMEGMTAGETVSKTLSPQESTFGEYDESRVQQLPLSAFPEDMEVHLNEPYELMDEHGHTLVATFKSVDYNTQTAVVDFNHPFAGKSLKYEIVINEVRKPRDEEKDELKELLNALLMSGEAEKDVIDELLSAL